MDSDCEMDQRSGRDYFNECNFLIQDKADLLSELENLRRRNKSLEFELKEILEQYEDLQKEEDQQKYQAERTEILEQELEDLKQIQQFIFILRKMNESMKLEYQQQIGLLKNELDIVIQEKLQLQEENMQLKGQGDSLYNKVFEDKENINSKTEYNDQLDRFRSQIKKLKSLVDEKIVHKKKKSNGKSKK